MQLVHRRQELGFDFDFASLIPNAAKGYATYQQARNQIQIERSKANADIERSRIAAAAAAAASSASQRGGMWKTALPYAVAAVAGVGLIVYLARR